MTSAMAVTVLGSAHTEIVGGVSFVMKRAVGDGMEFGSPLTTAAGRNPSAEMFDIDVDVAAMDAFTVYVQFPWMLVFAAIVEFTRIAGTLVADALADVNPDWTFVLSFRRASVDATGLAVCTVELDTNVVVQKPDLAVPNALTDSLPEITVCFVELEADMIVQLLLADVPGVPADAL